LTIPFRLAEAGHGSSNGGATMATNVVKQIRRVTRRKFSAEEKIRVVLEGLRGEIPVSELCRKHGIQSSIYYKWSKAFLDAGKNGLTRDTQRDARINLKLGRNKIFLLLKIRDSSRSTGWRGRQGYAILSVLWMIGRYSQNESNVFLRNC
jgi:transposase-like protein